MHPKPQALAEKENLRVKKWSGFERNESDDKAI